MNTTVKLISAWYVYITGARHVLLSMGMLYKDHSVDIIGLQGMSGYVFHIVVFLSKSYVLCKVRK